MGDLIEEIRKENIKYYGECVLQLGGPEWGDIFTNEMYKDRTHFVYEILQNAEDACERKSKITGEKNFKMSFKLSKDTLEIRHNGIVFDDNDIRRICGIGKKKEKGDTNQIGKFGIGFKSIYAYTKSPYIYSGNNAFCIENLVLPKRIDMRNDLKDGETLFSIPFNHKEIKSDKAYKEIENRLKNLEPRILLFLRNIGEIEITYEIDGMYEKYTRTCNSEDGYRWVILNNKDGKVLEKWLVFEKPIQDGNERLIEVAYLIKDNNDDKNKNINIIEVKNSTLVVYFPTEKETHLNFLIQAPFNTTATRENILEDDDWNKQLIPKIAEFVVETITKIKYMKLLNVDFLKILPIDSEYRSGKNDLYNFIYDKVKDKLKSDEELLPADDGSYVSVRNALLARGTNLRVLLSNKQLFLLFKKTKWLNEEITEDKSPLLINYLKKELEVQEIDPEIFAKNIDENFLKEQSDEWIIKFYNFLLGQEALWRQKSFFQPEGVLRSKPIIRLENDIHVPPFNKDGKANAYLQSSDKKINLNFPTIKDSITSNLDANNFLKKIGLSEPDVISAVIDIILPKYMPWNKEMNTERSNEDISNNIKDVLRISKAIKTPSDNQKYSLLLEKIKQTEFLYCKNVSDETNSRYCAPSTSIYLGKSYTGKKDIEIFFEGNDKIWMLDDRYLSKIDLETLKDLGCKDEISVISQKNPLLNNNIVIIENSKGRHSYGEDGFDPNCEIEGLEWAIKNITFEKSLIIWNILKKYYNQINGTVIFSKYQDYKICTKENKYSKMGELLLKYPWLYTEKDPSLPHKANEIMLSDLSNKYDKECYEAKKISEHLYFKKEEELPKELKENFPYLAEIYEQIQKAKNDGISIDKIIDEITGKINNMREKHTKNPNNASEKDVKQDVKQIGDKLINIINPPEPLDIPPIIDNTEKPVVNPLSEEEIEKTYGKSFYDILKKIKLGPKQYITKSGVPTGGLDMNEYLYDQYNGHCQICNVKLLLGNGKDGKGGVTFNKIHIIEIRNENEGAEMEWNVLCLCPNHHALFKYGKKELKGIYDLVNDVMNENIASELITERQGGRYYIAKIKLMSESGNLEEKELYYTEDHMGKFVAFIKKVYEVNSEIDKPT
ncbi:MAG: sacsin N-terminal ATP-binding-like domain-containing protein [Thermoplasmata archaeon]